MKRDAEYSAYDMELFETTEATPPRLAESEPTATKMFVSTAGDQL